MGRFIVAIVLSFFTFQANASEIFGSIAQFTEYESNLPCESATKSCGAINGLMGMALDTASKAGLEISKVIDSSNSKSIIYVQTKKFGVCRVELKNIKQLGAMGFLCSSRGFINKQFQKIDRILSLRKSESNYTIADVTRTHKLKSNL